MSGDANQTVLRAEDNYAGVLGIATGSVSTTAASGFFGGLFRADVSGTSTSLRNYAVGAVGKSYIDGVVFDGPGLRGMDGNSVSLTATGGKIYGSAYLRDTPWDTTYIHFYDSTEIKFYSSGVESLQLDGGHVIFNEDGADKDIRMESSTNANMFKLDGGNSEIGIGAAPTSGEGILQIAGNSKHTGYLRLDDSSPPDPGANTFLNIGGDSNGGATYLRIHTNNGYTDIGAKFGSDFSHFDTGLGEGFFFQKSAIFDDQSTGTNFGCRCSYEL